MSDVRHWPIRQHVLEKRTEFFDGQASLFYDRVKNSNRKVVGVVRNGNSESRFPVVFQLDVAASLPVNIKPGSLERTNDFRGSECREALGHEAIR
jgi:hypothetical protein